MINPILLLGPSGIGKTTIVKQLTSKVNSVAYVILDNIAHRYARDRGLIQQKDNLNALIAVLNNDRCQFLAFGQEALKQYCKKLADKPIIVDVGTGFLDAKKSPAWVAQSQSICLIAEPVNGYERFRQFRALDLSYERYIATQFSERRREIYDKASMVVKTDDVDANSAAHRFAGAVFGMLPPEQAVLALSEWLKE